MFAFAKYLHEVFFSFVVLLNINIEERVITWTPSFVRNFTVGIKNAAKKPMGVELNELQAPCFDAKHLKKYSNELRVCFVEMKRKVS